MFAVFYKDEFVDWWLNQASDKNWVERTIQAKGWNAADVDVLWFDQPPREEVALFNPDKSITVLAKTVVSMPEKQVVGGVETDILVPRDAWAPREQRAGRGQFIKGKHVKPSLPEVAGPPIAPGGSGNGNGNGNGKP